MIVIVDAPQGSDTWHEHRRNHWNASDAPAMMGCSPYKTRNELLREYATGIQKTHDEFAQRRFEEGHRAERLARLIAEKIIGESLYPIVVSNERLSASLDGSTLLGSVIWEHKLLNDDLRECFAEIQTINPGHREALAGQYIPLWYRVQLEQQLHCSGAEKALFMASSWDEDGELIEEYHCWYTTDLKLREQIIRGWEQFEADVKAYVPTEPAAIGKAPDTLPALHIEVTGHVTASNLTAFKSTALAAIQSVNRDLVTDQDFADAEKTVKWCSEVESRIAAAKQHALSQTASINDLFNTMEDISSSYRQLRLDLSKLVAQRKTEIRNEIVSTAHSSLMECIDKLNERIGGVWVSVPPQSVFWESIKGLKTGASVRNAADTELARQKIAASELADRYAANRKALIVDGRDWFFLFADFSTLGAMEEGTFPLVVQDRIRKHEADKARATAPEAAGLVTAETLRSSAAPTTQPPTIVPLSRFSDHDITDVNLTRCLSISALSDRLGVGVSVKGLAEIGVPLFATFRAGSYYKESEFRNICLALARHFTSLAEQV